MKILNKVKVFDFNNPNFEIKNNREDVFKMVDRGYITIVKNITDSDGNVIQDSQQKPIGVIRPRTASMIGDEIFADIESMYDINGEFINKLEDDRIDDDYKININKDGIYLAYKDENYAGHISKFNFKLELEASILILIEEILDIRIGEVSTKMAMIMYGLDFLAENVLPQIFEITGEYEEEISDFIGKLFNLIFTLEEQEDGSYLAKFDYEKLHKLNEEFSTMSILDMVDLYFGEESTEILYYIALELFELEIAEIPEYLDSLGFDTEAII